MNRLHVHVERRALEAQRALPVHRHGQIGVAQVRGAGSQAAGGVAPHVADIERIDRHSRLIFGSDRIEPRGWGDARQRRQRAGERERPFTVTWPSETRVRMKTCTQIEQAKAGDRS